MKPKDIADISLEESVPIGLTHSKLQFFSRSST